MLSLCARLAGKRRRGEGGAAAGPVRRSGRARRAPAARGAPEAEVLAALAGAAPGDAASARAGAYSPPAGAPEAHRAQPAAREADSGAGPARPHKRDAAGGLVFPDWPGFRPRLSPEQMIRAGVFGGCYFNPSGGKKGVKYPRGGIPVDHNEYPKAWFEGVPERKYISRRYCVPTNKYGVKAGQDQTFWEEKGWVADQDPRGWFQWYTRFYLGRRTEDDARQIGRWTGVTGPKGRWKRALMNRIVDAGAAWDDARVSPVIRQTLLHWASEVSAADVAKHAKTRRP